MSVSTVELAPVEVSAVEALFTQAHTAHAFTDEPVSDEQIHQIYDMMKMAPTSMNTQPLRITWVRSGDEKQKLGAAMNDGNRAKTLGAPLNAILSVDTNWHEHFGTFAPWAEDRKGFFAANEAIRVAMGTNNAHIQAGYFITAVRAVGLAAGPMGGFDAAAVDAAFNQDNGHHALIVVNIGHPTQEAYRPRGARLDFEVANRIL